MSRAEIFEGFPCKKSARNESDVLEVKQISEIIWFELYGSIYIILLKNNIIKFDDYYVNL